MWFVVSACGRGDRAERRVPGEVGGLEERLEIPVVDDDLAPCQLRL